MVITEFDYKNKRIFNYLHIKTVNLDRLKLAFKHQLFKSYHYPRGQR